MARGFFLLTQALYVGMYVAALLKAPALEDGLGYVARAWLPEPAIEALLAVVLASALVGIAVRLYLATSVLWDHVLTGVRFRRAFPCYFLLDELWALMPLAMLESKGLIALPCVAPLAFLPFAQRTLIRSAYDLKLGRRFRTG
jgi:hypothetical protein